MKSMLEVELERLDATPHVLLHRTSDGGKKVRVFNSKKEAHSAGMEMRRQGADVTAWSVKDYKQFVDSSFDESKHPRDENGRWT